MSAGGAAVAVISGRRLATLEFGSHGSPLSCVIYNKSLEIRQKSQKKVWFHDLWQRLLRDLVRQIGGCASMLSAWLGGKQDDLPLEGIEQVPILTQTQDYHFVLHWLHEHLPRYVMAALVARVNPDRPEIIWTKYGAKFAGDVSSKRVLYGLQAIA